MGQHTVPVAGDEHLRSGTIGVRDLVFLVVAAAAPLYIMAGLAPVAIGIGGIGAPGGYLMVGALLALFAVGYTAMSRYIRNAGAFYAYIARGLGRPAGGGAALVALLGYCGFCFGLIGAFGYYAAVTVEDLLGISLGWEIWALALIAVVGWLGFNRISISAKVLAFFLSCEVLLLVALAVAVLVDGGAEGLSLHSFQPATMVDEGVAAMIVFAFGAFAGFEATTIYSEEARDPRRTISRATYLAVAFLALFYAFICWIVVMAFGPTFAVGAAGEDPAGMVFVATDQYLGSAAKTTMDVLIVTSLFASVLAFHNSAARYFFALGRESLLSHRLAHVEARTGAPRRASLIVSVLAVVVVGAFALAGADPILQLLLWVSGLGALCIVVLQALCAAAVIAYFHKNDHPEIRWWQSTGAPALAAAGLVAMVVLIIDHFDLLTGASAATNLAIMLCIPVAFAIGTARALWLRSHRPDVYADLTTVDVERVLPTPGQADLGEPALGGATA